MIITIDVKVLFAVNQRKIIVIVIGLVVHGSGYEAIGLDAGKDLPEKAPEIEQLEKGDATPNVKQEIFERSSDSKGREKEEMQGIVVVLLRNDAVDLCVITNEKRMEANRDKNISILKVCEIHKTDEEE